MNQVVENPFGNAPIAARPSTNAVAQTDQQRAIAEVQAAMMIARLNPRDPIASMDRILNACARPALADSAVYTYSRGGSDVSGPSIRLAETLAQNWGNIKTSVRELDQVNGVSTVQTIAWDLETGYQCDKVFQVPHIRYTRQGAKRLEDPRDIYELIANQGARRLRACILAVIPGDVTEAAVAQCEVTMKAKADTSPEGIAKIVGAFEQFGVTKEQIEKRIQRRLDAIQPAQVVSLKKIYASLRDGMSQPSEWFEAVEQPADEKAASKTESVKETLRKRTEQAKTEKPQDQPPQDDDPFSSSQPEQPDAVTYAQVAEKLERADAMDVLDVAADLIPAVADEQQRKELSAIYQRRQSELQQ
jgi:hypothetical protein